MKGEVPAFSISGDWKHRPGCGLGLGQSSLTGEVRIGLPAAFDPAPLEQWMTDVCRLPPSPSPPEDHTALALAQRAAHWALAIQRHEGIGVGAKAVVSALEPASTRGVGTFRVSLPCVATRAASAALAWVQRAVSLFLEGPPEPETLRALKAELDAHPAVLRLAAEPGQNSAFIVQYALDAGLPVQRVVTGIARVGTGSRARTLFSSITDRTPSVGVALAANKVWTAQVLRTAGLPGAVHRYAPSAEAAVRIAGELGYPVVVKPADQEQGRGVFADLRDEAAVREAWSDARAVSELILVERHFEGPGHRLTIFDGQLFKVTRKLPAGVVGDGRSTIEALAGRSTEDQESPPTEASISRARIELDREALGLLAQRDMTPASVPDEGVRIALRRRNNAASGGVTEVLDPAIVHPDNLALGLRAARLLGLDWAGVDLLIPDIAVSWLVSGALICEVNAQPQVDRRTAGLIVDAIVRDGCRIPVHLAILSGGGDQATMALRQHAVALGCDGIALRSGLWIRGRRVTPPLADGLAAGLALLASPDVTVALCAMTPAEILRSGLPVDRFDSCVVLGKPPAEARAREALEAALRFVSPHLASVAGG